VKLNTLKACRRHKTLIIGDSHVRDLSEKIGNCLDNSFSITGITKPNADLEAITPPIYLKTENLAKKDLLIIYGRTKYISRNETSEGLHSLKGLHKGLLNECYLTWSPSQM